MVFVLVSMSFAQSQPPPSTPFKMSQEEQNKTTPKQTKGNNKERVSDSLSSPVLTIHTPSPDPKSGDQAQGSDEKPNAWTLFNLMLVFFNGLLAIFTFLLWRSTHKLWKASQNQSVEMRQSIAEAVRSADAIQQVALSMAQSIQTTKEISARQERFGKMQLRAYVSINLFGYVKQDRESNYKYEIRMLIRNTGHTPAHEVKFAIRVAIMPFPLPEEIDVSLPMSQNTGGHIASGQQHIIAASLDSLISDEEVQEITHGKNRKLYVFGTVWYQDAFGEPHYTNFCQWGLWDIKGNLTTINVPRHNEAT